MPPDKGLLLHSEIIEEDCQHQQQGRKEPAEENVPGSFLLQIRLSPARQYGTEDDRPDSAGALHDISIDGADLFKASEEEDNANHPDHRKRGSQFPDFRWLPAEPWQNQGADDSADRIGKTRAEQRLPGQALH